MSVPYAEVIGDPISHSKSPLIHKFWLAKLGIDADYRATHVKSAELAGYFAARRQDPDWRGCNVTLPHKVAVLAHLGNISAEANAVGAANTVLNASGVLTAYNTDIDGVLAAIGEGDLSGYQVCIIGTGGAARAALKAVRSANALEALIVARRLPERSLNEEFDINGSTYLFDNSRVAFCGADIVINATPLGMAGQPEMPQKLIGQLDFVDSQALVFDMVYFPLETPFLAAARARGIRTSDGLEMLIGQAARAFELIFAQRAPCQHNPELRELLTR